MTQLKERNDSNTNATTHFTTNAHMSELINEELDNDGHYHPNLGGISRGGMANHYPMTLLSMHELGATDDQINGFKQQWPRNRALIDGRLGLKDKHELTVNNWHLYLGDSKKLKEFRRIFLEQLYERDVGDVITAALAYMQNGLPMGLFHPLIRLSFSALHGDKGLLADALAYMAIRYHDVYQTNFTQAIKKQTDSPVVTGGLALSSWSTFRDLIQNGQLGDQLGNPLVNQLPNLTYGGSIHVCELLCASPVVHELVQNSDFIITQDNLPESMKQISKVAVQLYLSNQSLSTLHAVTACQALVDLTTRMEHSHQFNAVFSGLWQRYWLWLTALFIEKGCTLSALTPRFSDPINAVNIDWKKLSDLALNTKEVHVIKMVYSCKWLFEQIDTDPIYKQAAKTAL